MVSVLVNLNVVNPKEPLPEQSGASEHCFPEEASKCRVHATSKCLSVTKAAHGGHCHKDWTPEQKETRGVRNKVLRAEKISEFLIGEIKRGGHCGAAG